MARLPDIERRLLNWARWRIGSLSGGMGYARTRYEHRVDGEGYDAQSRIPTDDCEAEQTDRAIAALEPPLQRALAETYLRGDGAAMKARRAGCSEATLYARVERAHRLIAAWLTDHASQARSERQRTEALQRSAAPGREATEACKN